MEERNLFDFKYYRNRELSWLQFNERVLEEARDVSNPLLERMRFLSIFSSNLEEFIIVRVGSIKDLERAGYDCPDISGMKPSVSLSLISQKTHEMVKESYLVYDELLLELAKAGIRLVSSEKDFTNELERMCCSYFDSKLKEKLSAVVVKDKEELPLIKSGSVYACALVKHRETKESGLSLVEIPKDIHRLCKIELGYEEIFVLLDEIVKKNYEKLLQEYEIESVSTFRISRNADLTMEDEGAEDLLLKIESMLHQRELGRIIRADFEDNMDPALLTILTQYVDATRKNSFYVSGPIDLTFFNELYERVNRPEHKEKAFTPIRFIDFQDDRDIFRTIRIRDRLLITPFESFDPVARFIARASEDKSVLAIKQTLYRVDTNSPIVKALAHASSRGKDVTVLVEVKARFDEKNNIGWARMLEKAGCHVIYSPAGLKTHGKISLVIREEEGRLRHYLHMGTGNYNTSTAKRYTDISLFTANEELGRDAVKLFNVLSDYAEPRTLERLVVAPLMLKNKLFSLIEREIENAKAGRYARIIAKMNSLCDTDMIEKLYEASNAGVKIDLIVRGICSLKTGIAGVSENITVRSVVGRFLEHSRIFYFENSGYGEYYCSSADWMPRNLERRVEIMFPIYDEECKQKLNRYLINILKDNIKARNLLADGLYVKLPSCESGYSYQDDYVERNEI